MHPQLFNTHTGFYIFPPTDTGIMKFAIHSKGYVNTCNPLSSYSSNDAAAQATGVSTPRTILTPGAKDGLIPREAVEALRKNLALVYPRLAKEKDFAWTRLCWYLDTPSTNWIISPHPQFENLILATGGCGHAFKFLPLIGREVIALIRGTLKPSLKYKWRFEGRAKELGEDKDPGKIADVRGGGDQRKALAIEELATWDDLKVKRAKL